MRGFLNPLPCTQGRGQGEGTASRDIARFASHSIRPLTPALPLQGEREKAHFLNFLPKLASTDSTL